MVSVKCGTVHRKRENFSETAVIFGSSEKFRAGSKIGS